MVNPLEQNSINSISGAQPGGIRQTPAPGQTSFFDFMAKLLATAGSDTLEANLLQDWRKLMTDDQTSGTPVQPHHPHHLKKTETNGPLVAQNNPINTTNLLMTATTPGVDSTAAADNSNTGSINGSTLV